MLLTFAIKCLKLWGHHPDFMAQLLKLSCPVVLTTVAHHTNEAGFLLRKEFRNFGALSGLPQYYLFILINSAYFKDFLAKSRPLRILLMVDSFDAIEGLTFQCGTRCRDRGRPSHIPVSNYF